MCGVPIHSAATDDYTAVYEMTCVKDSLLNAFHTGLLKTILSPRYDSRRSILVSYSRSSAPHRHILRMPKSVRKATIDLVILCRISLFVPSYSPASTVTTAFLEPSRGRNPDMLSHRKLSTVYCFVLSNVMPLKSNGIHLICVAKKSILYRRRFMIIKNDNIVTNTGIMEKATSVLSGIESRSRALHHQTERSNGFYSSRIFRRYLYSG